LRRDPLRWSQAAGGLLLLFAAACMAAVVLDSELRPCRSCAANAALVRAFAVNQMSWVPSGRPTRYPLTESDGRFDPYLPLPSPDPADVVFPLPFVLGTKHGTLD
jgi:hypothetical protein